MGKENVGKPLVQKIGPDYRGKAKLPVLGMLMLDQKSGKRELGGFDHPGSCLGPGQEGGGWHIKKKI